jgi:hypothetical protein
VLNQFIRSTSVAQVAWIVVPAAAAAVDNGLEYSPDEIVVSNGAKQAIWQVR